MCDLMQSPQLIDHLLHTIGILLQVINQAVIVKHICDIVADESGNFDLPVGKGRDLRFDRHECQ